MQDEKTKELRNAIVELANKDYWTCVVYGGWDDKLKEAMTGYDAKITFLTGKAGFIRCSPSDRHGPPTIVCSQRRVKAGKMDDLLKVYQKLSEFYKAKDHGVVAISASPDPEDPNLIHDL